MINGELPEVYGSGEQTRDYVYVDDVVRANMSSVEYDGSVTVNIGTGQEITVNEVFRTVREKTGAKVKKTHGSARPGEQQRSVLSYEKAHEKLGWRPEMSFEEGVSKTVEWFRRRA
jgi:UDP-glucose 4-epimerase